MSKDIDETKGAEEAMWELDEETLNSGACGYVDVSHLYCHCILIFMY